MPGEMALLNVDSTKLKTPPLILWAHPVQTNRCDMHQGSLHLMLKYAAKPCIQEYRLCNITVVVAVTV